MNAREIRRSYFDVQMKTPEYQAFKGRVINFHGGMCWQCGGTDRLVPHHLVYRDVKAWEYEMWEMRVYCWEHHRMVHEAAEDIWIECLSYPYAVLEKMLAQIKGELHSARYRQWLQFNGKNPQLNHNHHHQEQAWGQRPQDPF